MPRRGIQVPLGPKPSVRFGSSLGITRNTGMARDFNFEIAPRTVTHEKRTVRWLGRMNGILRIRIGVSMIAGMGPRCLCYAQGATRAI